MKVRIFAVTKDGLAALAVAVAALWTCVGLERTTRLQATRDAVTSMQILANLRHRVDGTNMPVPARAPAPVFRLPRPSAS
jgi:hypothetical protein